MLDKTTREEEGLGGRGFSSMHDPLEVFCLGRLGAGSLLLRAAAHAVVLAAYLETTRLAGPVVPEARSPDTSSWVQNSRPR